MSVPVRRSSVVVGDARLISVAADDDGDGVPDKWGGVGRFAEVATDALAVTVDDLEEWDSDEDMEQLEFDLLDSAEDMESADADAMFEKSEIPLVGEDCWPEMVKIVEAKLEEETDDITISKLRHQEDRDIEGRGKKTFVANSAQWAELHDEWGSEIHQRRRKQVREMLKNGLQVQLTSENPVQRLSGLRGVWEMACRNTNHVNVDDQCLLRLTQALSEPSRELQACAAGAMFNLQEAYLEINSSLRKRLPFVVEALISAAAPRRKVMYNGGELRRMFDQQLQIQFGAGLTPEQKAKVAFTQFDADGGGTIDSEELRELLASLGMHMDDEQLEECLVSLDEDGSGDIDEQEFTNWFSKTAADADREDEERKARKAAESKAEVEAQAAAAAAAEAKAKAKAKGGADEQTDQATEGAADGAEGAGGDDEGLATDDESVASYSTESTESEEPDADEVAQAEEDAIAAKQRRRGSFFAAKQEREAQREATLERLARRDDGVPETEEQRAGRLMDEAVIEACAGTLSCMANDEKARKAMGDRGSIRGLLEMATRCSTSICANTTGGGIRTPLGGGGGVLNALCCLCRLVGCKHREVDGRAPLNRGGGGKAPGMRAVPTRRKSVCHAPGDDPGERMHAQANLPGQGFMVGIDRLVEVGGLLRLCNIIKNIAAACNDALDFAGGPNGGEGGSYPSDKVYNKDAFTALLRAVSLMSLAAKDSVARVALYEGSTWRCHLDLLHAASAEIVRRRRAEAFAALERSDTRAAQAQKEAEEATAAKKKKKLKGKPEPVPTGAQYLALLYTAPPAELQRLILTVLLTLRGCAFAAMEHCETVAHGGNSKVAGVGHTHALPGFASIEGGISHEQPGTAECLLRTNDIELLLRLGSARNRAATLAVVSILACLSHTTFEMSHQLACFQLKAKQQERVDDGKWRDEEAIKHKGEHAVILLLCRAARGAAAGSDKTSSDARVIQLFGIAGLAGLASDPEARRFLVHVAVPMPLPGTHAASGSGPLLGHLLTVCDHVRDASGQVGAGLRRHAAGALMLMALGCGDSASDAAELAEAHLTTLAAYSDPNLRWRWPRHHLTLLVSLLKHSDAGLVAPAALAIFCLAREATGTNSRTFVDLGAIPLLTGWVGALLLTSSEEASVAPKVPKMAEDETKDGAEAPGVEKGDAPPPPAPTPANSQLRQLTHYERAMLLEFAVGAIWMLMHGGSDGGDVAYEGSQIDDVHSEMERNGKVRAAVSLMECGGIHVLADLVRVLPTMGRLADIVDQSGDEDERGAAAIHARTQQHAICVGWVATRAHPSVCGDVARAGMLSSLLDVAVTLPHPESGADVLVMAATRYLACQFLQDLIKLAVQRAAADAAAANDSGSESEGEEEAREAAEADTAALYAAAATAAGKRGQGSMEEAMLQLLDTPQMPAGQAYGGAVLAKLAVSMPRKQSIAKLGGISIALDEVRRTWQYLTSSPPPRTTSQRREMWEIRYEVFERAMHLLLNLSTDVPNQALIANVGLDIILQVAREGDEWLASVGTHGVVDMSEGRPRSRAATSGGPSSATAPTESLGGHGNAGGKGFQPVQCAKWILENLVRHPDSRTRFYTQELLLKADDSWAELMSYAPAGADGKGQGAGSQYGGSEATRSVNANSTAESARRAIAGKQRVVDHMEVGSVEVELAAAERRLEELLSKQRAALCMMIRPEEAQNHRNHHHHGIHHHGNQDTDEAALPPASPTKKYQTPEERLALEGAAPQLQAPIAQVRARCVTLRRLVRALSAAAEGGAKTEAARAEAAAAAAALAFASSGVAPSGSATAADEDEPAAAEGTEGDDGEMRWPDEKVLSASLGVVSADAAADRLGAEQAEGIFGGTAADAARRALSSPRAGYQQWWRGELKEQSALAARFAKPPAKTREQLAEAKLTSGRRRDQFASMTGPSADNLAQRMRLGGLSAAGAEAAVADASTTGVLPQLNALRKKMGALMTTTWDRDTKAGSASDDNIGDPSLLPHMRSKSRHAKLENFKDRWAPSQTDLFLAQYHLLAEAPLMLPEERRTVRVFHWGHRDGAGTCEHDLELPSYGRRSAKQRAAEKTAASAPGSSPKKTRRRKKGTGAKADSQAFEDSQKAIKALAEEAERARHVETAEEKMARRKKKSKQGMNRVHLYVHDKAHERVDDFAAERIPLPPCRAPTLRRPYGGLFTRRPRVPLPPAPKITDPPEFIIPAPPASIIPNAKTLPGPTWGVLPDENMYFVVITLEGVMPPLISPDSGDVPVGQLVTIECDTEDAEIFYTLDGSDPEPWTDAPTFKYTEPFPLTTLGTVPVRAIAADKKRKKPSPIADEEYSVLEEAKVKKLWTMMNSIWVPRLKTSESKDFYDSSKLHRRTFEQDWDRCMRKKIFVKFLARSCNLQGDELAREISEIKQEVWEDYDIVASAFDFYAACSTGDGFSIKLNAYSDFLDDCFIPEESETCSRMVLDTIFTTVNLEDDDGLSKKENAGNADREFVRCEFLEMVVRVGFAKYLFSAETDDPSEAIDDLCVVPPPPPPPPPCRRVLLSAFCCPRAHPHTHALRRLSACRCEKNILAHLEPAAAQHRNDFRRERLYTEEVDDVYRKYKYNVLLKCMFDHACSDKPGAGKDKLMNIKEWTDFMGALGFTAVRVAFYLSLPPLPPRA